MSTNVGRAAEKTAHTLDPYAYLGPSWCHLGAVVGHHGGILSHPKIILSRLEANLGDRSAPKTLPKRSKKPLKTIPKIGLCWVSILEPSWG